MVKNKLPEFPPEIINFYDGGKYDIGDKEAFGKGGYINFGYWIDPLPPMGIQISDALRTKASENLYRKILEIAGVSKNDNLLEIGTGRGMGAKLIHDEFSPKTYTGIDFSNFQIRQTHKRIAKFKNMRVVQADAHALPFPDHSHTVAISVEVLQHIKDPISVFREVYRILRPGGRFVFCTFFATSQKYTKQLNRALPLAQKMLDYLHPEENIQSDLTSAGFRNLNSQSIGKKVWELYLRFSKEKGEVWPQVQLDLYKRGWLDYAIFSATK